MAGDVMDKLSYAVPGGDNNQASLLTQYNNKKKDTVASPNLPEGLQGLTDQTTGMWTDLQKALWDKMMPGNKPPLDSTPPPAPPPIVDPPPGGGGPPDEDPDTKPIFNDDPNIPGTPKTSSTGGANIFDSLLGGGSAIAPGTGGGPGGTGIVGDNQNDSMTAPGSGSIFDDLQNGSAIAPGGGSGGTTPTVPDWMGSGNPGWQAPAEGLLGDASRVIAGSNPLLDQAALKAMNLSNIPPEMLEAYNSLGNMQKISGRQITGEGLQDDAAYRAAEDAFNTSIMPMIENQAALSGLGRSTAMTNASGARKAQTELPAIQDFFARQERGIDRELGQANQNFGNLMSLGDAHYGRDVDQLGALTGLGDYGRGVEQERNDAGYNDWLRKAGLFEASMNGPAGLLPSTIGSTTSSEGKGK